MNQIVQIVPITEMRLHHSEVLSMLAAGPVVLAQRSKPTAVLVSIEEWNAIAAQLAQLTSKSATNQIVPHQIVPQLNTLKQATAQSVKTSSKASIPPPFTPVALAGLWQGVTVNDEDIEQVRESMWAGFGEMAE